MHKGKSVCETEMDISFNKSRYTHTKVHKGEREGAKTKRLQAWLRILIRTIRIKPRSFHFISYERTLNVFQKCITKLNSCERVSGRNINLLIVQKIMKLWVINGGKIIRTIIETM